MHAILKAICLLPSYQTVSFHTWALLIGERSMKSTLDASLGSRRWETSVAEKLDSFVKHKEQTRLHSVFHLATNWKECYSSCNKPDQRILCRNYHHYYLTGSKVLASSLHLLLL